MTPPRFHFVVPAREADLDRLRGCDPDADWRAFREGPAAWSLQTYARLRRGAPAAPTCSDRAEPARVNLAHAAHLRAAPPPPACFVVSLQADYRRVPWADFHVVQNRAQRRGRVTAWMPHWPQPGLVPRDVRREGVRVVAAAGRLSQAGVDWRRVAERVSAEGFRFVERGEEDWNDFSGVDAVLAVRSFGRAAHRRKPPTKLVNGWLARVPVVAGWDSAYAQVGRPGVDYLRVADLEGLAAALRSLRDDPARYRAIVEAGAAAAAPYTAAAVARRWTGLLAGPVAAAFAAWEARGGRRGPAWRLARAADLAWAARRSRRRPGRGGGAR